MKKSDWASRLSDAVTPTVGCAERVSLKGYLQPNVAAFRMKLLQYEFDSGTGVLDRTFRPYDPEDLIEAATAMAPDLQELMKDTEEQALSAANWARSARLFKKTAQNEASQWEERLHLVEEFKIAGDLLLSSATSKGTVKPRIFSAATKRLIAAYDSFVSE